MGFMEDGLKSAWYPNMNQEDAFSLSGRKPNNILYFDIRTFIKKNPNTESKLLEIDGEKVSYY